MSLRRWLALALLVCPALVRADAFVPPPGKTVVEAKVGLENAADYPQYTFVLWPHDCYNDFDTDYEIIAELDDDDGRTSFPGDGGGCRRMNLFAFPRDAYPLTGDSLPQATRAQFHARTDPRVLVAPIDAESLWWVPDALPLREIRDVYRVELADGALELHPTRVLFDFGDGRVLDKPFNEGKRPRLPRQGDIPPAPDPSDTPAPPPTPAPPDTPAPPPTPVPPDTSSPPQTPAPSDIPVAASAPPARPSPPAAPATAASQAAAPVARPAPGIPTPLLYGGGCLLVALAAGLALRRR